LIQTHGIPPAGPIWTSRLEHDPGDDGVRGRGDFASVGDATIELTDDEQRRLEDVSRPPLIHPFWHHRKTASDRLSAADLSLLAPYLD
jgi:hypothetical protein